MNGRILFLLSIIPFLSHLCTAQISYEKRMEFELNDDYENEMVFEFDSIGFLMSSSNEDAVKKEREWKYEFFNTELELRGSQLVFIDKDFKYDESVTTQSRLHTFYKDKKGNFAIVSISASNQGYKVIEGQIPKKAYIKNMAILGEYAFFSASIKGSPYLFSINWKTGEQKLILVSILNIKPKKISILGFQYIEESSEMLLFAKVAVEKDRSEMHIVKLNGEGEKVGMYNLSKNIGKNLISASASYLSHNNYVFTGTYSEKHTTVSEGIFFCQAYNDDIEYINFINYLDLENFLTYLSEKKQKKIENKKERKEKRGKELLKSYNMVSHEVLNLEDGYLLLSEAYYATYYTQTYTTYSYVNGVSTPHTQTRQVFDGYQYTHAMLAKFGIDGQLVWDQTFEMWPAYKPYVVKQFISISEMTENSINLVFLSRNKINSKSFDYDGTVLHDAKSEELETTFAGDDVKRLAITNIDYWYENYFIAYGSQKIRNKENKEAGRKRKVFFVSKIKYLLQ